MNAHSQLHPLSTLPYLRGSWSLSYWGRHSLLQWDNSAQSCRQSICNRQSCFMSSATIENNLQTQSTSLHWKEVDWRTRARRYHTKIRLNQSCCHACQAGDKEEIDCLSHVVRLLRWTSKCSISATKPTREEMIFLQRMLTAKGCRSGRGDENSLLYGSVIVGPGSSIRFMALYELIRDVRRCQCC